MAKNGWEKGPQWKYFISDRVRRTDMMQNEAISGCWVKSTRQNMPPQLSVAAYQ